MEKAREFQKNIYFCFINYAKAFDCVDHNKLWKILKEMGIPDHLTCLLRNLYTGQEATVRTWQETTDWFQIGKGVLQGWYCHPAYWTSMQSTPWEMLGWNKHKLESRLPAAAAKSLQSCLTLCGPMDCSLPGSSIHGSSQARVLEWVATAFSKEWSGTSQTLNTAKISHSPL